MQFIWKWLDDYDANRPMQPQDGFGESEMNELPDPWWEEVVAALAKEVGRLNLS
jgi:hypothetical protein